ncbi:MAG TPA: nucleoside monophosphate kinase [Patescibacteria group bacterium]|nr:nucleoside monophosphate kinase [Patescibacteria group bacterium]
MRNIILFGSPGAGKSTLVELLTEKNLPYSLISVGMILRDISKEDSELGNKVRETMAKGDLLDDFFITELVKKALREVDKSKSIILDGYPRSLGQVNIVDGIFKENQIDFPVLVYVKISKQEAIDRLSTRRVCSLCKENFQVYELENAEKCPKCGGKLIQREDDKPEAIEKRFELFDMQFKIIEEYFKSRNRFFEIDGTIPKPERVEELIKIIQG